MLTMVLIANKVIRSKEKKTIKSDRWQYKGPSKATLSHRLLMLMLYWLMPFCFSEIWEELLFCYQYIPYWITKSRCIHGLFSLETVLSACSRESSLGVNTKMQMLCWECFQRKNTEGQHPWLSVKIQVWLVHWFQNMYWKQAPTLVCFCSFSLDNSILQCCAQIFSSCQNLWSLPAKLRTLTL